MHVLIARNGDNWATWMREGPGLAWSPIEDDRRLEPVVDAALEFAFKVKPAIEITFSTQQVTDVVVAESVRSLDAITLDVAISILCREGRFNTADDRFAEVSRAPHRRALSSGIYTVFRPHLLREKVRAWFEGDGWHTFMPPRPHRNEAAAPPWERMLLTRFGEGWEARTLYPAGFPTYQPGPVVSDEMAAKRLSRMPQSKSAVRRAQHQANAERFRREAEERRTLREGGQIASE